MSQVSSMRRALKDVAAGAIHRSGLRSALGALRRRQAGGRRVQIVSYHRVVEDVRSELRHSIPGLLIGARTFRGHLEEAHRAGYALVSLEDALEVLAGRRQSPRDLFVVTFDDGYRDVYEQALPILRAMGVPATMYLPTDFVGTDRRFNHDRLFHLVQLLRGRRVAPVWSALPAEAAALLGPVLTQGRDVSDALDDFLSEHSTAVLSRLIDALEAQLGGGPEVVPESGRVMSWDEVRSWVAAGMDVGAHTLGHCVLTLEPDAEIERQVRGSRERLEQEVGRPVLDFAYCNGWYSDAVMRALRASGYRSAVTTEALSNRIGMDPFTLKRKVMSENFSLGRGGEYSAPLTACQIDDVFGALRLTRPVLGRRA